MNRDVERRLTAMTRVDSFYRELLDRCSALSDDYHRICSSLSEDDREKLEMYISICEELEYRRTCLAYALGIRDGLISGTAQRKAD